MHLQQIGYEIRQARLTQGLTQGELAKAAGLSRATLNRLEMGNFPDLGAKKLQALLENVGLTLAIQPAPSNPESDFIRIAATTASVSFKHPLTEAELMRALLNGKVAPAKRPHFRLLFEEAKPALIRGLINEVSRWTKPGRIERTLTAIAHDVGATDRIDAWLKTV